MTMHYVSKQETHVPRRRYGTGWGFLTHWPDLTRSLSVLKQ